MRWGTARADVNCRRYGHAGGSPQFLCVLRQCAFDRKDCQAKGDLRIQLIIPPNAPRLTSGSDRGEHSRAESSLNCYTAQNMHKLCDTNGVEA